MLQEIGNIIKDIVGGGLPLDETPGFFAWLIGGLIKKLAWLAIAFACGGLLVALFMN